MTNVTINGESYTITDSLYELTANECARLYAVINAMPEKLRQAYESTSEEEFDKIEFTDDDYIKHFPTYYGKVLVALSDIPQSVMNKCMPGHRVEVYKGFAEQLVKELLFTPSDVVPIDGFHFKGINYQLPLTLDEGGNKKIGAWMEAIEFTESADIQRFSKELSGGIYEAAPKIIAILARPEGEAYDEDVVEERAKEFGELTMDVVFGVFFSSIHYISTYSRDMLTSLHPDLLKVRELVEQLALIGSDGEGVSYSYAMETTQD